MNRKSFSAICKSFDIVHLRHIKLFLTCLSKNYQTYTAAAKSLQSCLTLCNPIDSSPPGSAIPGILQAITLEWVAISFSHIRLTKKSKREKYISVVRLNWLQGKREHILIERSFFLSIMKKRAKCSNKAQIINGIRLLLRGIIKFIIVQGHIVTLDNLPVQLSLDLHALFSFISF